MDSGGDRGINNVSKAIPLSSLLLVLLLLLLVANPGPEPRIVLRLLRLVLLFATPWTVAPQAPLSMGILQARILEWVATPSSRGSSQPRSPASQVDSLPSEPPGKPRAQNYYLLIQLSFTVYRGT